VLRRFHLLPQASVAVAVAVVVLLRLRPSLLPTYLNIAAW